MENLINNYQIKEKIGEGQFGSVYKASHKTTQELVAIKIMDLHQLIKTPKLLNLLDNEIKTLQQISHPNIIKLYGSQQTKNQIYLIYEFCNGGSLEEKIQSKQPLNSILMKEFFIQMISAYEELGRRNILHRDIKPSNILLHNNIIKIADFGFCKPKNTEYSLTGTVVGSPLYMAPELLLGKHYNQQADIWSLGVSLYEMIFGKCPIEGRTMVQLVNRINDMKLHPIQIPKNNNLDDKMREILEKMLQFEPQKRCDWKILAKWRQEVNQEKNQQQLENLRKKNSRHNSLVQVMNDNLIKKYIHQYNKCWYCIQLEFSLFQENIKFENIIQPFFVILEICEQSFLNASKLYQEMKIGKYMNEIYLNLPKQKLEQLKQCANYAKQQFMEEIQKYIKNNSNSSLIIPSFSEKQGQYYTQQQQLFVILNFIKSLKGNTQEKIFLQLANEIITGLIFDEVFENLCDQSKSFCDQKIFNLNELTSQQLEQMLQIKLNYLYSLTLQ